MFKKKFYFVLVKYPHSLRLQVVHYMYLKDGKFKLHHQLHTDSLLYWYQAIWYRFNFWWNGFTGNNEKMFGYKYPVNGYVQLKSIADQ